MTIISQPELTYSKEHKCSHCNSMLKVELKDLFRDTSPYGTTRATFRCPVCHHKNHDNLTTEHFANCLPKEATESYDFWLWLWTGMFLSSLLTIIMLLLS